MDPNRSKPPADPPRPPSADEMQRGDDGRPNSVEIVEVEIEPETPMAETEIEKDVKALFAVFQTAEEDHIRKLVSHFKDDHKRRNTVANILAAESDERSISVASSLRSTRFSPTFSSADHRDLFRSFVDVPVEVFQYFSARSPGSSAQLKAEDEAREFLIRVVSLLLDDCATPNEELCQLVARIAAEILSQRLRDQENPENFNGGEPSSKRPRIDPEEQDLPFLVAHEVNKHLLQQKEKKNPGDSEEDSDLVILKEVFQQRRRSTPKPDPDPGTEFAPRFDAGGNYATSVASSDGAEVRSMPFGTYDDPNASRPPRASSTLSTLSEVTLRPWSLQYWGEFCDGRFRERKKRENQEESHCRPPSEGPNADPIRQRTDRLHQLFPESNADEIYARLRVVASANLDAEFDRMTESLRKIREEQRESPLVQVIMEPISPPARQQQTAKCEKDGIPYRIDDRFLQQTILLPDEQDDQSAPADPNSSDDSRPSCGICRMEFDGIADLVKHLETQAHWDRMRRSRSRSSSPNESVRTQNSIASMPRWLSTSDGASILRDLPDHAVGMPTTSQTTAPPKSPSPELDADEAARVLAEAERILAAAEMESPSPEPGPSGCNAQGPATASVAPASTSRKSAGFRGVWERCLTLQPEVRSRLFCLILCYPGTFDWVAELDSIISRLKAIPRFIDQLKEVDRLGKEQLKKYHEDRQRRLQEIQQQRRLTSQPHYLVAVPFRAGGPKRMPFWPPPIRPTSATMPPPPAAPAPVLVRMPRTPPLRPIVMPQHSRNLNPRVIVTASNSSRPAAPGSTTEILRLQRDNAGLNSQNAELNRHMVEMDRGIQLPYGIRALPPATRRQPTPAASATVNRSPSSPDDPMEALTHLQGLLRAPSPPPFAQHAGNENPRAHQPQFRWENLQAGLSTLRLRLRAQRMEMETTMRRWERENTNLEELLDQLEARVRMERARINANQSGIDKNR